MELLLRNFSDSCSDYGGQFPSDTVWVISAVFLHLKPNQSSSLHGLEVELEGALGKGEQNGNQSIKD